MAPVSLGARRTLKGWLALTADKSPARGLSLLIYHRIGGGTLDERDLDLDQFERQLDLLAEHRVVSLDEGLYGLELNDDSPRFALTFDDGFGDIYNGAWPMLREREMPFTIYLCTAYVGKQMRWDGSTASTPGPGLTWDQLEELADSPLCTIGNHTHTHARPEALTTEEIDRCTTLIEERLHVTPRHFAYTWGIPVPDMEPELNKRFHSVVTGELGRNLAGQDLTRLRRIPVRKSDPIEFFAAKLTGTLKPERIYDHIVNAATHLGLRSEGGE